MGDVEATAVKYIGMQGEHTHDKRKPVIAKYELLGCPEDTKGEAGFKAVM